MPSESTTLRNHFQTTKENSLESNGQPLDSPDMFSDLRPRSFWVPEVDEREWFDSTAVIIQRKNSIKLTMSFASNLNRNFKSLSHSYSNWNNHPAVIGPFKPQKASSGGGISRRNRSGSVRMSRSRSEPGGDRVVKEVCEPGSPRVSCMGRIEAEKDKSNVKRTGFWNRFKTALWSGFGSRHLLNKSMKIEDNSDQNLGY